jgi:hypothetical protein
MDALQELTRMVEANKARKQRERMIKLACEGPAMCCGMPTKEGRCQRRNGCHDK